MMDEHPSEILLKDMAVQAIDSFTSALRGAPQKWEKILLQAAGWVQSYEERFYSHREHPNIQIYWNQKSSSVSAHYCFKSKSIMSLKIKE
tara:strand:- start:173 stop:442 length:270 start_codon:yes stop_codon:yes gene_type:complete